MSLFTWVDSSIKKFTWFDISLIKLSTAAFVLMVAKLWEPLLALEWHWYLIISLVVAVRPMMVMFRKD